MSEAGHIERLIREDISVRQDNLARARIDYSRGHLSEAELKDYVDDVKAGEDTMAHWKCRKPRRLQKGAPQ
jgi:hypothetical protein